MNKDLRDILNIGKIRREALEEVELDNKKFAKSYKPRFKTTEDLKEYLLNPTV